MLGAMPQSKEATVKPAVEIRSRFFRPKWLASHPEIGMTIPLATRYEVSAQVASVGVAERLPAMCVKETLTTVVSSTSMKVASITAAVTSPGPAARLAALPVTAGCLPCSTWVMAVIGWPPPQEFPGAHRGLARRGRCRENAGRLARGREGLVHQRGPRR